MFVKQLRHILKNRKDDESVIFFCNGYAQPEITFTSDDVYGSFIVISHDNFVKPSPRDILSEDNKIKEDENFMKAIMKQWK